jgi:hypothetical protein
VHLFTMTLSSPRMDYRWVVYMSLKKFHSEFDNGFEVIQCYLNFCSHDYNRLKERCDICSWWSLERDRNSTVLGLFVSLPKHL